MANKNVTLKDANNNSLFPKTFVGNVFDENNVSLDHLISGLPLGMIVPSTVVQTDGGLHLLDGAQLSKTGVYTQFCTWLTAKYNADPTSVPTCTETEWQNEVTATGQCGKFVITSTTIRLPKITQFIEGLSSLSDLGKRLDAALPNITGSLNGSDNYIKGDGSSVTQTGALTSNAHSGSYVSTSKADGVYISEIGFDASLSNPLYGKSSTVQPQSVQYPYYIVVATIVKTQIQVDLDQYINDLNLKAGTDLANVSASTVVAGQTRTGINDRVVEYYVSSDGKTWYRKWASGWKECGGVVSKTSGGRTYVDVTFPNITFSTTDYTINGTYNEGSSSTGTGTTGYYGYVARKTRTTVRISVYGGSTLDTSWYACGY